MKFLYCFLISIFAFNCKVFSQSVKVNTYWQQLKTEPYKGKQDDIYFLNDSLGWYVNGSGKIYKTLNGGQNWFLIHDKPGTYFRCIGFSDSLTGFAGNIGTDYFPNVSDTIPIYKTLDGGKTWLPVIYKGPTVKGLCAIDIYREPFINAGKLDYKTHIFAGGRVGSPAFIMISHDNGNSFTSYNMSKYCKYILDIKFFNLKEGVICGASSENLETNNALIITTNDGGKTWQKRYRSKRPYELTWKCSFPSRNVGYVTIQSYDTSAASSQRYVAKTIDGGKTWKEIPLINDIDVHQFGIAFTDENHGWVGAAPYGFETFNGGKNWQKCYNGVATNKIRVLKSATGNIAYAIGVYVFKGKEVIESGYDVIAAMRNQYAGGRWYKNFTFTQDVFFYKDNKEVKKEVWYEAASFPGKLTIKFNSIDSKNGVIFSNNKVSVIKNDSVTSQKPLVHDLLLSAFDVYFLPPYQTTHLLDSLGYDLKKFHVSELNGRKIFVAGAEKGNETTPQLWIDAERWYLCRIIYKHDGALRDVLFDDYELIENNWVAKTIVFKTNGQLNMIEKYYDIKFPKELNPEIFNPIKFSETTW